MHETLVLANNLSLNLAAGTRNGPPLLLLHGVTRSWTDFAPLLATLTLRWHVHSLDLRGHGLSARAPRYLVADYTRDVEQLLATHFTEPVVLLGHSLGALVALGAAAAAPERVRAAILEDPPGHALLQNLGRTTYHAQFLGMQKLAGAALTVGEMTRALADLRLPAANGTTLRLGELRDGASLRYSARCLKLLDPAVLQPILERQWHDGEALLAAATAVTCPVLLLRGEEKFGGMLSRAAAEEMAVKLRDVQLVDMPNVGHLIHWLDTPGTLRLLCGFLESLR